MNFLLNKCLTRKSNCNNAIREKHKIQCSGFVDYNTALDTIELWTIFNAIYRVIEITTTITQRSKLISEKK